MKKFLSFLLALMMVLSLVVTMVACQDPEQPNDDKPSTDTPGTTDKPGTDTPGTDDPDKDDPQTPDDPQMPEERIPLNYLPTEGFGGASFHILQWSAGGQTDIGVDWIPWEEGDVEQEDGDMLGTAVFQRNAWVEETYKVDITMEYGSVDQQYFTDVRADALVESDMYQMLTLRTVNIVGLIEEELFADMNDYEQYMHFDQPWWVQDSIASFTLGSHLYVAASEILLRDKGATAALFFNQVIANDYSDLPNFFELAANKEWTLEEMIFACETVSHPNDGDDQMNSAEDIWGISSGDDPVYYLYNGFGYKFAHIDEDGYIDYDFADEGSNSIVVMQNIFEKVMYADWYMNTMTVGKNFLESGQDIFVEGTSLFKGGMVKDTTNRLKNMTDMYGILPYPLYDVDQAEYSSLVWEHHDSSLGIPAHAKDKEMCAIIIEALSWESYYSVYPIFYETILLNRAARDEESKEMLKIIFNTRSYDPGLYWDRSSGLHGNEGLLRLSQTNSSDIASLWAKFESKVAENMDEVNDWITDKEY